LAYRDRRNVFEKKYDPFLSGQGRGDEVQLQWRRRRRRMDGDYFSKPEGQAIASRRRGHS
jgi:hypothetical protein